MGDCIQWWLGRRVIRVDHIDAIASGRLLNYRTADVYSASQRLCLQVSADEVRQLLAQGRLPDADAACRKRPSPLAFVLISGLAEIDFGWQAMEKAMEDAVAEQAAKLYRKIEYLSVIAILAPMCGLLGTVTGMIMAFQQVAVTQGTAGASQLAKITPLE